MTDNLPPRTIPAPTISLETKTFWEGLNEGKLLIKRCGTCDTPHYFPRGLCPHCGSADTRWEQVSGKGEVYSLSVTRRGPGAPYVLAYVTLDEGVSLLTNIVDCRPDDLAIGQLVHFAPVKSENGQALPSFAPVARRPS